MGVQTCALPFSIRTNPFHGHVPSHLPHPVLVRMARDARHLHSAAFVEVYEKQHGPAEQAAPGKHFTVKKSQAAVTAACPLMNSFHPMPPFRLGAGEIPCRLSTLPTV